MGSDLGSGFEHKEKLTPEPSETVYGIWPFEFLPIPVCRFLMTCCQGYESNAGRLSTAASNVSLRSHLQWVEGYISGEKLRNSR